MRTTLLEAAQRPATPWKNGGGRTWTIAASPKDTALDGFDWRISLARVEADGPFSRFPGIARTLAVLEGAMRLGAPGQPGLRMDPATPPLRFEGDAPMHAEVLASVLDLNLMHDPSRCHATLQRMDEGEVLVEAPLACFVASVPMHLAWTEAGNATSHLDLQAHDAVRWDDAAGLRLQWPAGSSAHLIQVTPLPSRPGRAPG